MNLKGSLNKLLQMGSHHYDTLNQRFSANSLIKNEWAEMARDKNQQAECLGSLHPSFWKLLKENDKETVEAFAATLEVVGEKAKSGPSEGSLHDWLGRTLDLEEPVLLKIYAPLIFRLRTDDSGQALGFYIMVNAQVTRLARLIRGFSGDPSLIQRCLSLQSQFEKAAQGPEPKIVPAGKTRRSRKTRTTAVSTPKRASQRGRPTRKAKVAKKAAAKSGAGKARASKGRVKQATGQIKRASSKKAPARGSSPKKSRAIHKARTSRPISGKRTRPLKVGKGQRRRARG